MAKRKIETGLGRGLDALIGESALQPEPSGAVFLPISQVEPGLNQPRTRFDAEALEELTESVRIHGILQPLTVRRLSTGYYQIIAGERRWRAAKSAGLEEVPVTIIEADDRKALELGLIENLQRTDLNPVEEAQGYQALVEKYGLTREQVAQQVGKSRSAISNSMRLLALPTDILAMLEEGFLTEGHARAILPLENADIQIEVAQKIQAKQLSVRQTEALVKALQKEQGEGKEDEVPGSAALERETLQTHLESLEQSLSGKLGRKVRIQYKERSKKGRIELEYYDPDDLEVLLSLLETLGREEAGANA